MVSNVTIRFCDALFDFLVKNSFCMWRFLVPETLSRCRGNSVFLDDACDDLLTMCLSKLKGDDSTKMSIPRNSFQSIMEDCGAYHNEFKEMISITNPEVFTITQQIQIARS